MRRETKERTEREGAKERQDETERKDRDKGEEGVCRGHPVFNGAGCDSGNDAGPKDEVPMELGHADRWSPTPNPLVAGGAWRGCGGTCSLGRVG